MLKHLLTRAPLLAVLAAVVVFVIVASAGMGLEWQLMVAIAAGIFAVAEAVAIFSLKNRNIQNERHFRQIRFIADRFQSMLRSAPGGYCMFTPQGMLREEQGVAAQLNVERIAHMDDLVYAIKEGPDLLESFRKMQLTGEEFVMDVHSVHDGKQLQVTGRRFRIGTDGPQIDVIWFCYHPRGVVVQATAAAVATTASVPHAQSKEPVVHKEVPMVSIPRETCFDSLPFPVWARSADLKLVMCNAAYAAAMDARPASVLSGQMELMGASSKGGRSLAQLALEKAEAQTERDHAVIAGKRCLMQITERPFAVAPPDGEPADHAIALFGFAIDVTAEEDKEKELRRHLVSHHEVMEHLGSAICVYGADTRLEFYNRAYQRLWEADEAFLDGKPTFGEVIEDLRARRRIPEQQDFQKYKKERLSLFTSLLEPREDVMYLPDGTSLRVLSAPHPLGGLMFVHENVTDQLALETSYNTLMAVQKETIDNLAEGIVVFGPDGRLRLSNPAFLKMWNVPEDFVAKEPHVSEVIERVRDLMDVTPDWVSYKAKMVGYALDRKPRSGRIDRTDKAIVEVITVPLPDGSVLNSFLNVTDSVKVEQALRASNAALATADRLKSDFVANVSYQLRTPLNTITGFADILAEQYFGKLNERQLEYTTTIKAESEKLARLINDVLDLATIEAGRMTLDRHPVSVAGLLNEAKLMTAAWARQQMIEILIDCPSDLGSFEVDEQRMKQVLFNLISNAIKYTPAGGQIAMAAWRQDEWIVVSVLDTGVGIPEMDRERVFGKFEKSNTHLRQSGAGLGLSLVKSFVELHGGRVEIFSDDKDGTRVSCFLPQKAPVKDVSLPAKQA